MKYTKLYKQEEILLNKEEIKSNNAFIKKDGSFYLVEGYAEKKSSKIVDEYADYIATLTYDSGYLEDYYNNYLDSKYSEKEYSSKDKEDLSRILKLPNNAMDILLKLKRDRLSKMRSELLKYKRSILVQYYGFAQFARTLEFSYSNGKKDLNEESILPNPEIYGVGYTQEQIETMKSLLELNKEDVRDNVDDSMTLMLNYYKHSNWNC